MAGELYVSMDVEADGPAPGLNSMLSIGSAAFTIEKQLVATFSANLETLEQATTDPDTMRWWERFPDAWEASRRDLVDPETAMKEFAAHLGELRSQHGKLVFMAYPASYDWQWVNWYLRRFAGENPFGTSGLCLKSYAAAMLKSSYREVTKKRFPDRWFDDLRHTHVALDDAIQQGAMGINMLRETLGFPPIKGLRELQSD